jgi:hypothetical protein
LEKACETLDADLTASTKAGAMQRLQELRNQVQQAIDALPANSVQPLIDALTPTDGANPAAGPAGQILAALDSVEALSTSPFIAAHLRALIERPFKALHAALRTVQDAAKLIAALLSPLENSTIRYEWTPKIKSWPEPPLNAMPEQIGQSAICLPKDPAKALAIAVEIRTGPTGEPQSDVSAQLRDFALQLLPGEPLMAMTAASSSGSVPAANPRSTSSSTEWNSSAHSTSSRNFASSFRSMASPTHATVTSLPRARRRVSISRCPVSLSVCSL